MRRFGKEVTELFAEPSYRLRMRLRLIRLLGVVLWPSKILASGPPRPDAAPGVSRSLLGQLLPFRLLPPQIIYEMLRSFLRK